MRRPHACPVLYVWIIDKVHRRHCLESDNIRPCWEKKRRKKYKGVDKSTLAALIMIRQGELPSSVAITHWGTLKVAACVHKLNGTCKTPKLTRLTLESGHSVGWLACLSTRVSGDNFLDGSTVKAALQSAVRNLRNSLNWTEWYATGHLESIQWGVQSQRIAAPSRH